MNKIEFKNHEEKEFWKAVVIAVASSGNYVNSMYQWADKALEYFRERNIKDLSTNDLSNSSN
ncbi:hypothetical protein PT520_09515 [Aliarcobacter butzleri]|uniref:Uncharacterized protein n=1 Tax=Aliarcobacter butzleri TaxID=28197 RepID=A0AAW6VP07_9BACT|nr:hypothetical protein [Aliarcobacter butzleri]MDK2062753.1 hypothetical protein [Aliarcobacter butzleri]